MRHHSLYLFSISPILFLIAFSQYAGAQTPQRDNRPRTASISGRVTIAGKPAVNAVITVEETGFKPDVSGTEPPLPFKAKARTDGEGRYLFSSLAEGRYVVSAMLKAFVVSGRSFDAGPGRTVSLDAGEAREKVDFALIRGGVITGKVMDDEGVPLIANRVWLYTVNEQGQKIDQSGSYMYEMAETDDRGVYRIYALPPGRYIVSAGRDGKFATTYHPDTTDEKQARVIEIEEGSEVTEVDIRFGSARKTYAAEGRVVDRETGKPVPRVYVSCGSRSGQDGSSPNYGTSGAADAQGNFRLTGLLPGRYYAWIMDVVGDAGYTSETAEFEVTNDNVSGVELKAFLGASVSGFVVMESAGVPSRDRLQSITVYPRVTSLGEATDRSSARPVRINADGSFVLKGLTAGRVSFMLLGGSDDLRIKRIERDGVEVKDAIEIRTGENIAGVRIIVFQPQGRIRGQVQIAGGSLPDNWGLQVYARRPASADEAKSGARAPGAFEGTAVYAFVDEKGRFVIERMPAGEYDLSITLRKRIADGSRQSVNLPESNRRVTVSETGETPVTITIDLNRINQPDNRPNNEEERR